MSKAINQIAATPTNRVHHRRHANTSNVDRLASKGVARTEDEAVKGKKPSRHHAQRNLHHLDRAIRHSIKDALRASGPVEPERAQEYRDLSKDFRASLKDAFHAASEGGSFDHAALLTGVSEALTNLAEYLGSLNPNPEALPGEEVIAMPPVPDDGPTEGVVFSEYA